MIPVDAFAVFDRQDSGCVSYGAVEDGRRVFVKCSTTATSAISLRRAVEVHRRVRHPSVVALLESTDDGERVRLTYPWVPGVVLNHATVTGSDRSGLRRFRFLEPRERAAAVDTILDAHLAVTAAGFVSVDLYDGCFLYDFDASQVRLIDLDEYRPGPFAVTAQRLPGSLRYMAPEEFRSGATIDERTTVFHLGRTIEQLMGDELGDEERAVSHQATAAAPDDRYADVGTMVEAWWAARAR